MFVHFNGQVVNADTISWVDYKNLKEHGYVRVHFKDGNVGSVEGGQAIQLLMELDPDALEGERLKTVRHGWAIHNLIGHPLMQVLAWLHLTKLGIFIHDITVPVPMNK